MTRTRRLLLTQLRSARRRGDRAALLMLRARLASEWCRRCQERCVRPAVAA